MCKHILHGWVASPIGLKLFLKLIKKGTTVFTLCQGFADRLGDSGDVRDERGLPIGINFYGRGTTRPDEKAKRLLVAGQALLEIADLFFGILNVNH